MEEFEKELIALLNKYSKDSQTNTPDYVLADALVKQLKIIADLNRLRDAFRGG